MDASEIKIEFKKRRKRQLIIGISIIPVVFFVGFAGETETNFINNIPNLYLTIAGFILIAAVVIFSLFNWRCPSCDKYLGKRLNHKFCSSCGVELK